MPCRRRSIFSRASSLTYWRYCSSIWPSSSCRRARLMRREERIKLRKGSRDRTERQKQAMTPRIIDRGRGPEIEGTRVTIYRIMDFVCDGTCAESIASELELTAEQVRLARDYIVAHQSEIEIEYAKVLDRVHQPNPAW